MRGQVVAEFDGLRFREVTEDDYATLEEWIAADPAHASLFEPDFFLGREVNEAGELAADPRATCYALENDRGTLFYVRLSRAARVHIQFPPATQVGNQRKTALALCRGMAYLEVGLERAGASEWIFATESQALMRLAKKALGFVSSPSELVRSILRLEKPKNLLHHVQQSSQEGR